MGEPSSARWIDDVACEARRSLLRETPCWLASMIVHMAIIVLLGSAWMPKYAPPKRNVLEAFLPPPPPEQPKVEIKKQEFLLKPSELPNVGSVRTAGAAVEFSTALARAEVMELPRRPPETLRLTDLRVPLALDITAAPNKSDRTQIRGVAGDGAVGTLGALDRITLEILRALERGPVHIVWFFDQSGSMQIQRTAVRDRFDQVYEQLGLSTSTEPTPGVRKPLLTTVVAFGKEVTFRTPQPTDDLEAIKAAVDGIENDDSGIEMTFTAVGMAAEKFEALRLQKPRRQTLMVLFTDEVGEDENRLEDCVTVCKRYQMPVYVAGVPAPFGRPNIEIAYVDPDPTYDQSVQWIPVRQGPETFLPEQVQLNFTGKPNRDDALYRLDSGFGPYCLTRLCVETGGIFFAVHGNRERVGEFVSTRETPVFQARLNYFFDPAVMRPYRPDYVPVEEYRRQVTRSKAKAALVQAAQQSILNPMQNPQTVFRKTGEDDSTMKAALDEAQRKAAVLEPRINALFGILKEGEKDAAKLTELRWRAGFELAYGRVLAVKVRTEAYNQMLARAKGGLKLQDPKSNVFTLVPADEVTTGSQQAKLAETARELLTRVAREHRGTPWGMIAETELKDPIGWKWVESYDPPPPPTPPRQQVNINNNARPNNNPPQFRRLPQPKPVRQNVKL